MPKNKKSVDKKRSTEVATPSLDDGLQVKHLLQEPGLTESHKRNLQAKAKLFLPFYLFFFVTCCAEDDETTYEYTCERHNVLEGLLEKLYFTSLSQPSQSLVSWSIYRDCCQVISQILDKAHSKASATTSLSDTIKNQLANELNQLFQFSCISVSKVFATGVKLKFSQEGEQELSFALDMALINWMLTSLDQSTIINPSKQYSGKQHEFKRLWEDLKKYTDPKAGMSLLQFNAPFVIGDKIVKLPLIVNVLQAFKSLAKKESQFDPLQPVYDRLEQDDLNYELGFALLTQLAQNVRNQLKRQQFSLVRQVKTYQTQLFKGCLPNKAPLTVTECDQRASALVHQSTTNRDRIMPPTICLTASQSESLSIGSSFFSLSRASFLCQQSIASYYSDEWYDNCAKTKSLDQLIENKREHVQANEVLIKHEQDDLNKIQQQTAQQEEVNALKNFDTSNQYSQNLRDDRQSTVSKISQLQTSYWNEYLHARDLEEQYTRLTETLRTLKQ